VFIPPPLERIRTDFVVVGAGIAGLRAAIELAKSGKVFVIAKDSLRESSSEYAQGGIAAALSDDDEIELHEQDTLAAGDGLCNVEAVRTLVEEGPAAIEQLIDWGTAFDRAGTKLLFAREGAHSRNRVLHAHGDSTGREIVRTLFHHARECPNIIFKTFAAVTDLLMADGEVAGVAAVDEVHRSRVRIESRAVLLATGGLGRVFENTTNPDVATGDGVACAYRAGAVIEDIEFVQFHPTALHVEGAPRFLLSEALRGEGAYLRNSVGERFMERYHPLKELAPRDVVSRSIVRELRDHPGGVFLDLTHLPQGFVKQRFPRIYSTCLQYGIDLQQTPAPVRPAAHYAMGGVATDLWGGTNVKRLYAAGEVACTGVHGANRLASNSLLEGVVFGARAGQKMAQCCSERGQVECDTPEREMFPGISEAELRLLAWNSCGILRNGADLSAAFYDLCRRETGSNDSSERAAFELRNMHEVAMLIACAASGREESRGGHYRTDFPEKSIAFEKHSRVLKTGSEPKLAFR
jgi:L-aspartate oxidase